MFQAEDESSELFRELDRPGVLTCAFAVPLTADIQENGSRGRFEEIFDDIKSLSVGSIIERIFMVHELFIEKHFSL